jgi:hypothetical protein
MFYFMQKKNAPKTALIRFIGADVRKKDHEFETCGQQAILAYLNGF